MHQRIQRTKDAASPSSASASEACAAARFRVIALCANHVLDRAVFSPVNRQAYLDEGKLKHAQWEAREAAKKANSEKSPAEAEPAPAPATYAKGACLKMSGIGEGIRREDIKVRYWRVICFCSKHRDNLAAELRSKISNARLLKCARRRSLGSKSLIARSTLSRSSKARRR